jgi:hypothetical protein
MERERGRVKEREEGRERFRGNIDEVSFINRPQPVFHNKYKIYFCAISNDESCVYIV